MKRTIVRIAGPLVLSTLVGCAAEPPKPSPPARPTVTTTKSSEDKPEESVRDVELKVVKLGELNKAIEGLKGKVVLVDVWATFCAPCVKKFPDFVALHNKYGKDGLACVSLTVDTTDDKDKALFFLKNQKANFLNFLIDESAEEWQTKLDIGNPPNALIYDRDGKRVKKFSNEDGQYTFEDVEKVLIPLLKK